MTKGRICMPTTPPPPHDESAWPQRINQPGESSSAGNVPSDAFDPGYPSHEYVTPPQQQPYPSQQPPQPQQRKMMSRRVQYLIVAGAVLVTILCCGGVLAVGLNDSSPSTQAVSATVTDAAAAAATVPFTPFSFTVAPSTPTPVPPTEPALAPSDVIFAPTLGGTIDDFQQRFGPDTDGNGTAYEATIAGQKVEVTLTLDDTTQSLDGQTHVVDVQVQAVPGEQWSSAVASTIAKAFLPSDARYQKTTTTSGVRDYVYYSKGMKATFTADQFTNGFGNVTVA